MSPLTQILLIDLTKKHIQKISLRKNACFDFLPEYLQDIASE